MALFMRPEITIQEIEKFNQGALMPPTIHRVGHLLRANLKFKPFNFENNDFFHLVEEISRDFCASDSSNLPWALEANRVSSKSSVNRPFMIR